MPSLRLCVDNHLAKQEDDIHYKTLSGKRISFVGNEIRTEEGFKKGRVLSFLQQYYLKVEEIKQVFDLDSLPDTVSPQYELVVFVINSPFVILLILIKCRNEVLLLLLLMN